MNPSLLKEILNRVKEGRPYSKETLGAALGTSAAMAGMMIEHLIRLGCLEEIADEPGANRCALCGQSRASQPPCTLCPPSGRALALTPKGMKQASVAEDRPGG